MNNNMNNDQATIPKPPSSLPPLPLSITENGALATAPLSTVVNSATDALYQDLYNLVHGDIKIVSVAANATAGGAATDGDGSGGGASSNAAGGDAASVEEKLTAAALGESSAANTTSADNNPNDGILETRKQRMANLSFAQRRHELTRRVVQHTKSLAHVYALTAASVPKSHSALLQQKALKTHTSTSSTSNSAKIHDPPPRLGATVQVSSDALQFVKSGWVSQDEAQDALYFHHDGLWKARAHCHDVLGALCVLSTPTENGTEGKKNGGVDDDAMQVVENDETCLKNDGTVVSKGGGRWPDFPTDVALAVDRYETSKEKSYSISELQARLASAVRRKLVLGEVGAFGTLGSSRGAVAGNGKNNNGHGTAAPETIVDDALNNQSRKGQETQSLPWRVVLGKGGGSIRLTYGTPRTVSTAEALRQRSLLLADNDKDATTNNNESNNNNLQQYPIEARLSVLSEESSAPWKLLSIHVQCSPKTGESDHQLVLNRKQMFDLHRIGDRCMIVEEAICRKKDEEEKEKKKEEEGDDTIMSDDKETITAALQAQPIIVPRPLHRLFEVTHAFALSLQMEILSSQAEALRRGAWGGSMGGPTARGTTVIECITVSPAYFYEQKGGSSGAGGGKEARGSDNGNSKSAPIVAMAVHFWSCDDRYGSPRVGDLLSTHGQNQSNGNKKKGDDASSKVTASNQQRDDNYLPKSDRRGEKRLSLCIRAVPTVGLVVSLSGGSDVVVAATPNVDIMKDNGTTTTSTTAVDHHMQRNVDKLLSSIQDPFQLSMSDALLAATVLCADRRCQAVVAALNRQKSTNYRLPSWIHLEVECGTISVAAIISYPTSSSTTSSPLSAAPSARSPTVLFRLACDSRTGRFVPVFPRPASLLRLLACNDSSASDIQSLRSAALASALGARLAASSSSGGNNIAKRADGASRDSTGRIVRDAFDALARSMDTLGRKCGVGGDWNDIDAQSASLREKSVDQTCHDLKASLMTCSGMAAVFGVAAIALKIAAGIDPVADMAGGPISDVESNSDLIRVPLLGVPLSQRIVEKLVKEGDGETKRTSQLQGELFAMSAKATTDRLDLVCFDVLTMSGSASSVPTRLDYANIDPPEAAKVPTTTEVDDTLRPSKRLRITKAMGESSECHHTLEEVEHATLWLDTILRQQ